MVRFHQNRKDEPFNSMTIHVDETSTSEDENSCVLEIPSNEGNVEDRYSVDLLYNVSDRPPVVLTVIMGFQQALLSLSVSLVVSSFVADVACAGDYMDIRTNLLSSTLLMNGITTGLMVTLGIRLPLFQGPSGDYVIPLIALQLADKDFCKLPAFQMDANVNRSFTMNITSDFRDNITDRDEQILKRQLAITKLQEFQGCLILAGVIHCLVGVTGAVGFLLKFIGPVTVVPTILLGGIYVPRAISKFTKCHWGITGITAFTAVFMSLYIGHRKMPFLIWSKKKGLHLCWYPLHQVFAVLIGMVVGWTVSAVMTSTGFLTDNPRSHEFFARTDARAGIISNASWFYVPYPNQFGSPKFDVGVFVAFLIGTMISILDSIGDYYACARICNVPPPPRHGVNRGIAVEGLCSIVSGVIGCGHATSTFGGNIGAIGITKVASRHVFLVVSIIYILFGIMGKVSAVFITIPYPVLGGAMIVMFGTFIGVVLSNLSAVSLSSTRNLAIIGMAILMGILVSHWAEKNPGEINTGSVYYDNIVKTLFSIPGLCGCVLACFLDNTVPGTAKERGITAWHNPDNQDQKNVYSSGMEVYNPPVPDSWKKWKLMKYLPICLYKPPLESDVTDSSM
ncbi:solute carrier family 23 member 1-like [Ylistrum balloti]|uniref:solute carrier family 23 member 1-like n=1 Tax=Ylistrum balloti TaxID=509963 RepID=UPI0029058C06|nr:solute carrier family 23 member 1-like [Ylistrum balloti]